MNNEHFGFKKSKTLVQIQSSFPAASEAKGEKLQARGRRQWTSVDFSPPSLWSHFFLHFIREGCIFYFIFLHCCRRTVEIPSSCGIFVQAGRSCAPEVPRARWAASSRHAPLFTQQCSSPTRCYGKFDSHKEAGVEWRGLLSRLLLLVGPSNPVQSQCWNFFLSFFFTLKKWKLK